MFEKISTNLLDKIPMLLFGPQSVGKTFAVKNFIKSHFEQHYHYHVDYLDCNAISA